MFCRIKAKLGKISTFISWFNHVFNSKSFQTSPLSCRRYRRDLAYVLSLRNIGEMMAERGILVEHSTFYRCRSKHRFRILDRRYAHAHVDRLHQQNVQSIETSSLHLGLLGDMKRLNSLFCAVAYNVLDQDEKDARS